MFKYYICVICCLLFVSCSNVSHIRTDDNLSVYKISDYNKVEVYSTSNIGKQYLVVGEVMASADAGESSDRPVNLLKEEASKLGADAIINLRLSFSYGYWSTGITATGTAVNFK